MSSHKSRTSSLFSLRFYTKDATEFRRRKGYCDIELLEEYTTVLSFVWIESTVSYPHFHWYSDKPHYTK